MRPNVIPQPMPVDRRTRTADEKRQTRALRLQRADRRRREKTWPRAAIAAERAGLALNCFATIAWHPLATAGERRDGHCLGLPPAERDLRIWAALRRVASRHGVAFVAMRAPEFDRQRGQHLHVAIHLPTDGAIRDALAAIERLTGAPADDVTITGRPMAGLGRQRQGVVAVSGCRGWMMQRAVPGAGGSAKAIAVYLAKATGRDVALGQHRLSNALSALARPHAALGGLAAIPLAETAKGRHGAAHALCDETADPTASRRAA
jgi:hypothetical protein